MNIKLHTPKSLKMGSGMSSKKQFLLSILATTVSIILTFGTAAVIDHNKKKKEKREIVMMVMYDMYNSLQLVEKADSNIQEIMDIQLRIAEDTTQYNNLKYKLATLLPRTDYTETTEHIFSTSIETINTVGNVFFTETVAGFYQNRHNYKKIVCDSIYDEANREPLFYSLKAILDFDFDFYGIISSDILADMQHQFATCKQIMDVTDEEIVAYRKERERIEKSLPGRKERMESNKNKFEQRQKKLQEAKDKLNLK